MSDSYDGGLIQVFFCMLDILGNCHFSWKKTWFSCTIAGAATVKFNYKKSWPEI